MVTDDRSGSETFTGCGEERQITVHVNGKPVEFEASQVRMHDVISDVPLKFSGRRRRPVQ